MNGVHLSEKKIIEILINLYQEARKDGQANYMEHLSNLVSLKSYLIRGKEIKKYFQNEVKILDWGAGFGQMLLILENLGFNVVPFDIVIPEKNLFNRIKAKPILGDKTILPFKNESFDAVLSCGVLEHVPDPEGSLREINRILKKEGYFFVFNFPYRYSLSELYASLRKTSCHPLKLTKGALSKILEKNNFKNIRVSYENSIPKNLSGRLRFLRNLYNKFPNFFLFLDNLITKTPFVRSILSNSLKVVAKK